MRQATETDPRNSTGAPIGADGTFLGTTSSTAGYRQVRVATLTDQAGLLYIEFSNDGNFWDSSNGTVVTADTQSNVEQSVLGRLYRIRYSNGSAAQGSLSLWTQLVV